MIVEIAAVSLLTAGTLFLLIGSIGVIRLPDFYCRAHAMSKPDTLGLILTLAGIILLSGWNLNSVKLCFALIFVAIANPAATHALVRAALRTRLKPWFVPGGAQDE